MLKPFMRLFGIDDDAPPADARREEDSAERGPKAAPGLQMRGSGALISGQRRKSETETELERAADARR